MQAPPPVKGQPATPSPFAALIEMARARNEFFKQEGVVAVLRDSNKPHGLLNMTGVGGEKFDIGAIPFVVFTEEEERLVGSKRYVEAHKNDLEKISGVLVHDTGTGRVLTLGLHDNYQDREIVDQVLAPLSELELLEPSMVRAFGTDHASFDDAGVPGFWCIQNMAEYSKTHHSQSDTFDKVWKDDLNQGAQVLAAWAYNTAQLPKIGRASCRERV